jgi:hypothetical protein
MSRQVFMTFFGPERWREADAVATGDGDHAEARPAHDSAHDDHAHHLTPTTRRASRRGS